MLTSATSGFARPQLHRLDIRVVLSHNGDARITETRLMSIDAEGTECYIGIGVPEGSEVRDLQVTDETGLAYENVGRWDIDPPSRPANAASSRSTAAMNSAGDLVTAVSGRMSRAIPTPT